MIVTISGMPGSGKSTVGRLLAKKLGYRFYSVGDMRGRIAIEMGTTIDGLNEMGMSDSWTDEKVDSQTKRLGETEDDFVIDGWIAFHFIPGSFKVFLQVDPGRGAERVFGEQREDEERARSVGKMAAMLKKRVENTNERYRKYYKVSFMDRKHYDLVIDTTGLSPQQVADRILEAARKKRPDAPGK